MNPAHSKPNERDLWLFGYGSLIWKADFDYAERAPASLQGWQRRFWQGSHDHRGTPEAPGRVVTLIKEPGATCVGIAYRIHASQAERVLQHLDFREKNGYERFEAPISFLDSTGTVQALVYIATPDNFAHLGKATDAETAQQIHNSVGPSGTNREYLFKLHEALERLNTSDAHVQDLVDLLKQIE